MLRIAEKTRSRFRARSETGPKCRLLEQSEITRRLTLPTLNQLIEHMPIGGGRRVVSLVDRGRRHAHGHVSGLDALARPKGKFFTYLGIAAVISALFPNLLDVPASKPQCRPRPSWVHVHDRFPVPLSYSQPVLSPLVTRR